MTTSYPGAVDAFSTKVDAVDFVLASHVNNIQDGLMAAQTAIGAEGNQGLCEGRLTLTTGVPITTADVTAATTIRFTPYRGNRVALHNGTGWITYNFTERSLSLAGLTANTNYDVFLYDNASTLTLTVGVWTNDSTRANALALQDGIYVLGSSSIFRYLGTIRITNATGQTEDSAVKRLVYNYYNQVPKRMNLTNASNHTYDSTTVRAFNNNALGLSGVAYVVGIIERLTTAYLSARITRISGDSAAIVGIGTDSSSYILSGRMSGDTIGTLETNFVAQNALPTLGYNELWANESGGATGTDPTFVRAVLSAEVWC